MNTIVNNFILSHGILDIYNANSYNINYTSYIFNYILLIICIEYLIIYLKELYIFIFLLLSAIHFSFDIFYLTNLNFNFDSDLENNSEIIENNSEIIDYNECLYISLGLITFSIFKSSTNELYIKLFNILELDNYKLLIKYIKLIAYLLLSRILFCRNITELFIYLAILLLNYFKEPIYILQFYFITIHIPLTIYKHHTNNYIVLLLSIFFCIITKMDIIKKINKNIIITGISIMSIHIIDNLLLKLIK